MPPIETAYRRQKAVLWALEGYGADGEQIVASPVELTVRWINKTKSMPGPDGKPIAVDAFVIVDQDIDVDSTMWEGSLEDWYESGSGGEDSSVMEVVAFNKTPDLKGRHFRRTVGLAFYKDVPPNLS
jgi:hypothetical protein